MKLKNPFLTSGYYGPAYFCDRDAECEALLSAIENERNVTLIAPRRYGKTGLIRKVLETLPSDYAPVYLDIYSVTNLADFTRRFAEAVVSALNTNFEKLLKTLGEFFRSCRPTATPSPDGSVKLSFDIIPENAEATLKETFDFLASRKIRPVIAIDEFQQVAEFPESGTEALLRSYIQFVPQVRFIFCGSRQHLMSEMFLSAQRPFFQSTQLMYIDVIPVDKYYNFVNGFYTSNKREIFRGAFVYLYERFEGITWYVQAAMNRLWSDFGNVTSTVHVDAVIEKLIQERALEYVDLLRSQNTVGAKLLRAVAREGIATSVMSGDFLKKYDLKSASSVKTALKTLLTNDLIYQAEKGYTVYDRFFGAWLAENT